MASTRASEYTAAIDSQDLQSSEDTSTTTLSQLRSNSPARSIRQRFHRGLQALSYVPRGKSRIPATKATSARESNVDDSANGSKQVDPQLTMQVAPPVSSKEVYSRINSLEKQLKKKQIKDSARVSAYVELCDLLCIILQAPSGAYDDPLIWQIFLRELQQGHAEHVAAALVGRTTLGNVGLVLRHLAISRTSNWKPPPQFFLDTPDAPPEGLAFDSATDPSFVVLEEAFFDLLCRLLRHRPYAVHAALDEHVHLVWPKYIASGPSDSDIIDFASAVESFSYTYQTYWKHSNPSPSGEVEALVLWLTSPPVAIEAIVGEWVQKQGQHIDALVSAVGHLCTSLSSIAASSFPRVPGDPQAAGHFDIVDNRDVPETPQLADTHPSLSFDILAHPALPFIFLAAELAWQSAHAVTLLNSTSDDAPEGSPKFVGSLLTLWKSSLKFVHEGCGDHPMRLAVCYLFACMIASAHRADKAGDSTAITSLTRGITSSPQNIMWLWDVSYGALSLQVHHANRGTGTSCNGEEEFLAAYAHRLPSILHLFHRVFQAEHSALIKVPLDSDHGLPQQGPPCRDARLVSAILYSTISSLPWKAVLDMFRISIDDDNLSQLVGDAYEYGRTLQSERDIDDGHRLSSDTDGFPAHLLSAARRNAVSRYTIRKPSLMQQVLAELGKGAEGHTIDIGGE